MDCNVFVPKFPNPANPRLNEWLEFFDNEKSGYKKFELLLNDIKNKTFPKEKF